MSRNLWGTTALASSLALGLSAAAVAQDAGDDLVVDEIVVEGELRDRTLQDTTTSVAVITGESLERRGDFDLYDVIERTPGISSSFGEKGFAIRGVDQRGVGGSGNGLVVSTTVDGATISSSNQLTFFGPYSAWDLEQVEILRGPQSTQTGRNALAGAVVIRSKDPTYELEAKARGELAIRNTKGAAFALNVPIIEDTLAVRFSAEDTRTDGFVDNPTLQVDDFDNRTSQILRGSFKFEPTNDLSIVGKYFHSRNEGGEDLVQADLFPGQLVNLSNVPSRERAVIDSGNLRITFDITDEFSVESSTNYFTADYFRLEDSDFSDADVGFITRTSEVETFEQELKLIYDSDRLKGVLGGYFTDISDVAPANAILAAEFLNPAFAFLAPGATIEAIVDQDTQTQNYAVFGELEFRVLPELGLIAGLRYDRESVDFTSTNIFRSDNAVVAGFLPDGDVQTTSSTFDAFLPKLGVVYDVTDDATVGFVVQRGYRAGGTGVNLLRGTRDEFDPEFTWNYEVSLRSEWFDDRLTVNTNAFYTKWNDQQVDVLLSNNPLDTITRNAGESRLFGGELEIKATPIDELDLFASLAYVNTEFIDFENIDDTGDDFDGNEFPFAPELTAAFGGTYFFDNGMYFGVDASYTGDSFVGPDNNPLNISDSRFLVNAQIGFEMENFHIFAYARNLFDETYALQTVANGANTEIERIRSGEPFTFGIVGTVKF